MATQIVELTGDEAALLRSLDKVIQKQLEYERKLRDTAEQGDAAGVVLQDALGKVAAESDKALNGLLRELKTLGPEGASAAEALKGHLTDAGKAGHRSMDEVLKQLRLVDPEAAEAATAAAASFREMAGSAENGFRDILSQLRDMGPEGRKVADELKKDFIAAGKIGEKSMRDVIDELEKLDPESAKVARELARNLEHSANRGKGAFASLGTSAVLDLKSIVTGYLGVQAAINTATDYLERQRDILLETKEIHVDLAKAQQEAAKNLAGLTVVERNDLLRNAVPDIAAAAGFSDTAEITQALGAVASAGESDPAKIREAVLQAARIERLTPDQLDSTAAAASAIQRQAGLADVRQAIALVETTGTQARITDPTKLLQNLPGAVGSLVATVPGQDREEAARQASALFAQITQGGNDEQGNASKTFAIDLGVRMEKFFSGMSDEQIQARSKIELIDRKIGKGTDTEADRQKKGQLTEFLAASEGLVDPAQIFGRLKTLQGNEALQRQFLGEGFGEKQFQTALKDLLTPTSDLAGALNKSFGTIQASTEFYEREAEQLGGSTPQLALARAEADFNAAKESLALKNDEGAALQTIRNVVSGSIRQTTGKTGYFESAVQYGALQGGTAAEEGLAGILYLRKQALALASDGITGEDEAKINFLEDQIGNLIELLRTQVASGSIDQEGAARARARVAEAAESEGNFAGRAFTDEDRELFRALLGALEQSVRQQIAPEAPAAPVAPVAIAPVLSAQQP